MEMKRALHMVGLVVLGVVLDGIFTVCMHYYTGDYLYAHKEVSASAFENEVVWPVVTIAGMREKTFCKTVVDGVPMQLSVWTGDGGKQVAYLLRQGAEKGGVRVDTFPDARLWPGSRSDCKDSAVTH